MKLRFLLRALPLGLGFLACAGIPPAARASTVTAEGLYRQALRDLERDGIDNRRQAAKRLERATLMAPDSARYHLELGRLYMRMGHLGMARRRFERVAEIVPGMADAHLGQAQAWRRDYLKYLDRTSLQRSLTGFRAAARAEPRMTEAWLGMLPLLVEEQRLKEAMEAAERMVAAEPGRPDGALAMAHVAFRLGQVERADSLFRQALPRLPRIVRDRFYSIAPVATEKDTTVANQLPPREREAFHARFWKQNDPDLGTLVNEAQLEYWSRVTQAYFLYFNPRRQEWDQRGEVYVRYGPPDEAQYNPVGSSLTYRMGSYGVFPMNVLVWRYEGLGMMVPMQDRLLSEYYLPPVSLYRSTDPEPDPDSLALRTGALATGGGRGVFPMLPPGVRAIDVDGVVARFQGESGPRLLGWLESPGAPGDSLWGDWVVVDSSGKEVARVGRPLGTSACDPAELRTGEFGSQLPPGSYLVGLSVRGASRDGVPRRGNLRRQIVVEPERPSLALSDMVVSCGAPDVRTTGQAPAVRLAANPAGRVRGTDPLTVYFEIYHLTPDADGISRLEFEYTVRSAERDRRLWFQRLIAPRPQLPDVSASRREEQSGAIRRQFVTVPVQSLPAGRFRLEIKVRDLVTGTEATRSAEFVHGAVPGAGS